MDKLSELSKPVAWKFKNADGGDRVSLERKANIYGRHNFQPCYSQEYVSALLAELGFEKQNNAGVAGMIEDYETKLEAKDKRIEELEVLLDRNIKRAKKLGELLDTPVQLQNCDFESVAIMVHWCTDEQLKAWVKGVEHAKKQIRAAGFKVKGDE